MIALAWDRLVSALCYWICCTSPSRCRVIPDAEDPDRDLILQFMVWPHHLYLQHFINAESYLWFHRHRWGKMRSWVLSGWFTEERPLEGGWISHDRFTTYTMTDETIHRVVYWSALCWTLFWVRDADIERFGFYPRAAFEPSYRRRLQWWTQFVSFRTHVKRRIPNLETGKVTT